MNASYFHIQDFLSQYRHESTMTAKLLSSLSDDNADSAPNPAIRSTRRIAWHLAKTPGNFGAAMGLPVTVYSDTDKPAAMADIATMFQKAATEFADAVEKSWTDENLADQFSMWGMTLTKGGMTYMLVAHEIHHRGQLQIIMRNVGDVPVGVMGPTQEEEVVMRAAVAEAAI